MKKCFHFLQTSSIAGGGVRLRPYAAQVLADLPWYYVRMNESSGTSAQNLGTTMGAMASSTYSGGYSLGEPGFTIDGGSAEFNGSGMLDSGLPQNMGTVPFAVECVFNPNPAGHGTQSTIVGKYSYFALTTADFPFAIKWNQTTNKVDVALSSGNDWSHDNLFESMPITPGVDHHLVFNFNPYGVCELWIDNVLHFSHTIGYQLSNGTTNWTIGRAGIEQASPNGAGMSGFAGRIAEVAIYYNKNLLPRTIANHYAATLMGDENGDPIFNSVELLLSGENIGEIAEDESNNGYIPSFLPSGAVIDHEDRRYGESCISFPNGGQLQFQAANATYAALKPDTQDFTFEGSFKLSSYAEQFAYLVLCHTWDSGAINFYSDHLNSGAIRYNRPEFGWPSVDPTTSYSPPLNTWFDLVIRRRGGTFEIWVNRSLKGSWTTDPSGSIAGDSIGTTYGGVGIGGPTHAWKCANIRFTVGATRNVYRTAEPFYSLPRDSDSYRSNVSLLLRGMGIIGSAPKDSSPNPNTLTVSGTPSVSDTQAKYGQTSIFFDGSDWLTPAGGTPFQFDTGDFTIEGWVYRSSSIAGTIANLISWTPATTTGMYPDLSFTGTSKLQYFTNGASRILSTTTISVNTWYFVAVSRVAGTTRMFINGIQEGGNYTDSNSYIGPVNRPVIGAGGWDQNTPFHGFMQDFRISKGAGRYATNFSPPARRLPAFAATDYLNTQSGDTIIAENSDLIII